MVIKRKRVFIGVAVTLLILISAGFLIFNYYMSKIKITNISKDDSSLGIEKVQDEEVQNILLLGVDASNEMTDSIMVLTIDKKNKKIKTTSLLRDMYLDEPGRGKQGLNQAYINEGAQFAIKTVNTNFNLDIKDYILVHMDGLMNIVDSLGGVPIDIKKAEIPYANGFIKCLESMYKVSGNNEIMNPGLQNLNGIQAVAYSRIRKLDSDFERTERQRVVFNEIFKKINSQGLLKIPSLIAKLLPYVETSLDKVSLVSIAGTISSFKNNEIKQYRIPVDGTHKLLILDGLYLEEVDLEKNRKYLHDFIYSQ